MFRRTWISYVPSVVGRMRLASPGNQSSLRNAARVCFERDTCELSFTFAFAVVKSLSASVLVA